MNNDANDFYINNLSSDESIEILKAKEFIQDNLNSPNNYLVNGNDISNTSKKEYYDRYSNLQGYNDNKDFYEKYLSIKNQDDTLKVSSLDLASGFIKPYKDTFSYIVSDPLNSSKDILLGVINPIGSGYEYGRHLREIYEKASLDSFLKDEAGYNKHGGELAGNAVPAIALGGKGVKLVKDKLGSLILKDLDTLGSSFSGYAIKNAGEVSRVLELPISTGRTEPRNLIEKITMKTIKENPMLGKSIVSDLKDPRLQDGLWEKYEYHALNKNGKPVSEIHYLVKFKTDSSGKKMFDSNGKPIIEKTEDFKFKDKKW